VTYACAARRQAATAHGQYKYLHPAARASDLIHKFLMSGYTHFAVLGAGNQGKEIVDALLAHKRLSAPHIIVTVLTRPVAAPKPLLLRNAQS
jgi:hypothetical protein